jgi:hypothetical protein
METEYMEVARMFANFAGMVDHECDPGDVQDFWEQRLRDNNGVVENQDLFEAAVVARGSRFDPNWDVWQ